VLNEYIIGAIAAAILSAGGWGYYQKQRADGLATEAVSLRADLATCGARLSNILEDVESDREVDNIPDDQLRSVPDHWLRPEGADDS